MDKVYILKINNEWKNIKYKKKKHKMPKKVCPNWDWVKSIEKKALTVIMSFPLNIALLNVRKTQKKIDLLYYLRSITNSHTV